MALVKSSQLKDFRVWYNVFITDFKDERYPAFHSKERYNGKFAIKIKKMKSNFAIFLKIVLLATTLLFHLITGKLFKGNYSQLNVSRFFKFPPVFKSVIFLKAKWLQWVTFSGNCS